MKTLNGITYKRINGRDDKFGNTPHVGVYFQTPDGNYFSGWIPLALWESLPEGGAS